jgi:glycosyltransferase involved in cell wall biosynthesis
MKIALLFEKYTPDVGGLAISAARLAHLLASQRHKVFVFAPSPHLAAGDTRRMEQEGIQVTRFGIRKRTDDTLVDWSELVLKEHKLAPFDLLHAYFLPQAGFVAAYAGNILQIPSIVSARGNDLDRAIFDPGRAAHILYALQHASALTTNSHDLAAKARALVPGREVHVIPNGVDTERFTPRPRSESLAVQLGLAGLPIIGFAGELREKKGLATMLQAFALLTQDRPAALLIAGDVRPGEDLRLFNEFRNVHPDLKLVVSGYVPHLELPAYYSLMDVFLHPSRRDGLPNALLEAMACSRPIAASPAGGMRDVIVDGFNGLLVPPEDAGSLASAICRLLDDKKMAEQMGTNARLTVLQKHTLESEIRANLAIYDGLAS